MMVGGIKTEKTGKTGKTGKTACHVIEKLATGKLIIKTKIN